MDAEVACDFTVTEDKVHNQLEPAGAFHSLTDMFFLFCFFFSKS